MQSALVAFELLAASTWVGGLFTLAVVARCAQEQLQPIARIAFFRSLGRRYLPIGATALAVAYAAGGVLIAEGSWSAVRTAIVVIATALATITCVAVAQARSLTQLRTDALLRDRHVEPRDLARHARRAGVLRGLMAALSVSLVVLGAIAA